MSQADKDIYDRELFRAWENNYQAQEVVAPRSADEQYVEDAEDWTRGPKSEAV